MKTAIDDIERGLPHIVRLKKALMRDFRPNHEDEDLNATHFRTLMYLEHHGPACMTQAGRHVGLEAGSFTPVADRLVEKGLVERLPDPDDRRRTLLSITPEARPVVEGIRTAMRDHFARRLSVLDDGMVADLAAAVRSIGTVVDALRASENEGSDDE